MILYEVRVAVDNEIAEAYRVWLETHIREILTLPGFDFAELLREPVNDKREGFVVHYWLKNRSALELYLRDHAPRLRQDGVSRFGSRFSVERRVLELNRRICS